MHQALLFDFNGVILNDEPQHCSALARALGEVQIRLDRKTYYREYLGFDDRECFRYAFLKNGLRLDDPVLEALVERKHQFWVDEIHKCAEMVPGIEQFIAVSVEAGYRLAVVSSALRREVEPFLAERGLRRAFTCLVTAEDITACKPDPQGYRKALDLLGVAPAEAIAFEDSIPGFNAARSAGLRCIMLTTAHPASDLDRAEAVWHNFVDHHPSELPWNHA